MRIPLVLACLLAAGCSVEDSSGDPQNAPSALRGITFPAASVTYRALDGAGNTTNYTRGPGFADGTSATVSLDGKSVLLSTSTTVDSGAAVVFSDDLLLPPTLSEFNGALHWPRQNQSLTQSAFGSWDVPGSAGVPDTGTFFSFGVLTDGTLIPATGSATYSGRWTGIQWTVTGGTDLTGVDVSGTFTAIVDYVQRTATVTALNASGTASVLAGVLSYAPTSNALTGASMTGAVGFNGNAIARFFGPLGEELGGTFRLNAAASPSGTNVVVGSFGAKRP